MSQFKIGSTVIYTDVATLDKRIVQLGKDAKSFNNAMHRVLLSGLYHARECGDTGYLARALDSLSDGSVRTKRIADWIIAHCPVAQDDEGNPKLSRLADGWKMKLVSEQDGRTPEMFKLEDAEAAPWWTFTPVKEAVEFTAEDLLAYLGKIVDNKSKLRTVSPEVKEMAERAKQTVANIIMVEQQTTPYEVPKTNVA